ncbi:MAG: cation:proton antiporter [Candidatus Neomarinimicrobiota bacterium]|nr:MAG: cation:proton antiporter [Candidatus Neomarinimicrobiota bacterium]
MTTQQRSRLFVFIFSFLVWIALTSIRDLQEVVAGLIVAALVSIVAGKFLITSEKSEHIVKRFFSAIKYLFKFLWEMAKANLHVAYIVIHPNLPIKPGIVKIKTKLTKDSAITVLTNSITLTPGTLTIDVNPETRELYIHWIDVESTDVEKNTKTIGGKFEKLLMEVFE